MKVRKLLIGVLAVGMPLTVMSTVVGVGAAWAVFGTGTYSCSKVIGTVTFLPVLKNGGAAPDKMKVAMTATGCTGGSPTPTKVLFKVTIPLPNNACTELTGSGVKSQTLANWPHVLPLSVFMGSWFWAPVGSPPYLSFNLSGDVTGSYPSASVSAAGITSQTLSLIQATCGRSAGLAKVTLSHGYWKNF